MAIVTILLIAAIILFLLAAFKVPAAVGLTDLGLACIALAMLLG